MINETDLIEKEHHKQNQFCETRPAYRQGRNLTAVKVYTVNLESQHLFIYGVSKINLRSELKSLCTKYGKVVTIHVVSDHKTEVFTECYHVQYERIQSARIAKRLLDNKSFYGGVLHVCYAPEYESVEETRTKLQQRCKDVTNRIGNDAQTLSSTSRTDAKLEEFGQMTKSQLKKKRKHGDGVLQSDNSKWAHHYQSGQTSANKHFKSQGGNFNYYDFTGKAGSSTQN